MRKVAPEARNLATTPKHVQEFIEECGDSVFSPSVEDIQSGMDSLVKLRLLNIYGKKHGEHTIYAMPDPVT